MKVLATGAVGFLESHLCERPIQPGRDIACLDNFVTGPRETFGTLMDPGGSGCCATTSARCSCSKWTGSITRPAPPRQCTTSTTPLASSRKSPSWSAGERTRRPTTGPTDCGPEVNEGRAVAHG